MKNNQTWSSISMTGSNNGALVGPVTSIRYNHHSIREYICNFIMSKLETNTIDNSIWKQPRLRLEIANTSYNYILKVWCYSYKFSHANTPAFYAGNGSTDSNNNVSSERIYKSTIWIAEDI